MIHQNWEYRVISLDEDDLDILEKKLSILGQESWVLVSFDGEVGILKRRQLYLVNPWKENEAA